MTATNWKCVMLMCCLIPLLTLPGCGGGGGDEPATLQTATPAVTTPPATSTPKTYATIDELAADMKTPEALLGWMKQNMSYLNPSPPDMSNWRYLSPAETFAGRQGDCIHQSAFAKEVLIKNGYACKLLFVSRPDKADHGVCYWPDATGKLWWIESAWGNHQGINGPFDNERAMAAKILEWLIAQDPGPSNTLTANYGHFDSLPYGIGWLAFLQNFVTGPTVP